MSTLPQSRWESRFSLLCCPLVESRQILVIVSPFPYFNQSMAFPSVSSHKGKGHFRNGKIETRKKRTQLRPPGGLLIRGEDVKDFLRFYPRASCSHSHTLGTKDYGCSNSWVLAAMERLEMVTLSLLESQGMGQKVRERDHLKVVHANTCYMEHFRENNKNFLILIWIKERSLHRYQVHLYDGHHRHLMSHSPSHPNLPGAQSSRGNEGDTRTQALAHAVQVSLRCKIISATFKFCFLLLAIIMAEVWDTF